jgi:uncharacterized OB-fold protein
MIYRCPECGEIFLVDLEYCPVCDARIEECDEDFEDILNVLPNFDTLEQ